AYMANNPNSSPILESATRRVSKATYVPLRIPNIKDTAGAAIPKFSYVLRLNLQPGEVDAIRKNDAGRGKPQQRQSLLWTRLRQFEGVRIPSLFPPPTTLAKPSPTDLMELGKAVIAYRKQSLSRLQQAAPENEGGTDQRRAPRRAATSIDTTRVA